jgi:cytochrome d ubiquinol oxidase subunit I
MFVGDEVARWVYNNEPTKFAAIELVPKTSSDVPETLFGHLNSHGQVEGGIAIPGLASILSDPSTGTSTVVQGLDSTPKSKRPTYKEVNVVHLAWDFMVLGGTLLMLLSLWYAAVWLFRRRSPEGKWFLRAASCAGILSIVALESGWVVTEVGRQPWIVFDYFKVKQAATTNDGVWITFLVIAALYIGVAVTLVLILRAMSRRFRERGRGDSDDTDSPYGPRAPLGPTDRELEKVGS